jgi:hypothetical protein
MKKKSAAGVLPRLEELRLSINLLQGPEQNQATKLTCKGSL